VSGTLKNTHKIHKITHFETRIHILLHRALRELRLTVWLL